MHNFLFYFSIKTQSPSFFFLYCFIVKPIEKKWNFLLKKPIPLDSFNFGDSHFINLKGDLFPSIYNFAVKLQNAY